MNSSSTISGITTSCLLTFTTAKIEPLSNAELSAISFEPFVMANVMSLNNVMISPLEVCLNDLISLALFSGERTSKIVEIISAVSGISKDISISARNAVISSMNVVVSATSLNLSATFTNTLPLVR